MKLFLRLAVSVFFIGLLFFVMRDELPRIVETLRDADKRLLALGTAIFFLGVLVLAVRLRLIFAAEDVKLSLVNAVNLTFVGYFFNNFLPTSVGGDIVKALSAARVTGQAAKSVTSVLMDRIFGLFTFVLIPSISFLFVANEIGSRMVPIVIYSFLFFSVFCFFLLFNRGLARRFSFVESLLARVRLADKARRIYDGLHAFKNHKATVVEAMGLSLVGQSISIYVLYLFARALHAEPSALYMFMLVPVVHLISMVPSLNGLGIREWAYVVILQAHLGSHAAAALGILWLGLLLLLSLIGGVVYLVRHDYHVRFGRTAEAST